MNAQHVDGGEHHHDGKGPERAGMRPQRQHLAEIVAKDKRQQGNGAGVDDGGTRPGVKKGHVAAKSTLQKVIVATRMRVSAAQFGVAKRTHHGNQRSQDPDAKGPADVCAEGSHHRGRLENASADDHAHDQGHRPQRVEQPLGLPDRSCHAHRRLA